MDRDLANYTTTLSTPTACWTTRTAALRSISDLADNPSALSPTSPTHRSLTHALPALAPHLATAVSDMRSAVVNEACGTVMALAEALGPALTAAAANHLTPALLAASRVTISVIASGAAAAAHSLFTHGAAGVPHRTISKLCVAASGRSAEPPHQATRAAAIQYLGILIFNHVLVSTSDGVTDEILAAIAVSCADSAASVRKAARTTWRNLHSADAILAAKVFKTLPANAKSAISKECDTSGASLTLAATAATPASAQHHHSAAARSIRAATRPSARPGIVKSEAVSTTNAGRRALDGPRRSMATTGAQRPPLARIQVGAKKRSGDVESGGKLATTHAGRRALDGPRRPMATTGAQRPPLARIQVGAKKRNGDVESGGELAHPRRLAATSVAAKAVKKKKENPFSKRPARRSAAFGCSGPLIPPSMFQKEHGKGPSAVANRSSAAAPQEEKASLSVSVLAVAAFQRQVFCPATPALLFRVDFESQSSQDSDARTAELTESFSVPARPTFSLSPNLEGISPERSSLSPERTCFSPERTSLSPERTSLFPIRAPSPLPERAASPSPSTECATSPSGPEISPSRDVVPFTLPTPPHITACDFNDEDTEEFSFAQGSPTPLQVALTTSSPRRPGRGELLSCTTVSSPHRSLGSPLFPPTPEAVKPATHKARISFMCGPNVSPVSSTTSGMRLPPISTILLPMPDVRRLSSSSGEFSPSSTSSESRLPVANARGRVLGYSDISPGHCESSSLLPNSGQMDFVEQTCSTNQAVGVGALLEIGGISDMALYATLEPSAVEDNPCIDSATHTEIPSLPPQSIVQLPTGAPLAVAERPQVVSTDRSPPHNVFGTEPPKSESSITSTRNMDSISSDSTSPDKSRTEARPLSGNAIGRAPVLLKETIQSPPFQPPSIVPKSNVETSNIPRPMVRRPVSENFAEQDERRSRAGKACLSVAALPRPANGPSQQTFACHFRICGRLFTREDSLVRHQRIHQPATDAMVLPHGCKECGRKFRWLSSAKSHAASCGSGNKPYLC